MEASFDMRCLFQKVMASLSNGKISCSFDGVSGYLQAVILSITVKAMAPHSSTLAWRILWMEEPGGLQSMGSLRVGHD